MSASKVSSSQVPRAYIHDLLMIFVGFLLNSIKNIYFSFRMMYSCKRGDVRVSSSLRGVEKAIF